MPPRPAPRLPALLVAAGLAACEPAGAPAGPAAAPSADARTSRPDALALVDVARERGLDYVNHSGRPEKATILEANGAGVALIDLESDGDLDVVFGQGLASLAELGERGADLEVFQNLGSGHFVRVPGPGLAGWWTGLATGDVDGDGDTDLVAAGFGALVLLVQEADGRLVPRCDLMPDEPGARLVAGEPREPGQAPTWFTSVALLDADGDGRLDLYAGAYLALDPVAPPLGRLGAGELALPCRWKGHDVYCGPRGLDPQADRLLLGLGEGRFEDVSARNLVDQVPGYTLAVLPFDADGDGDTDLAVAADSSPNLLWVNDGSGRFREGGWAAGLALGPDGSPEAGMGLAAGDVDRDGRLDLALTNFSDEPTGLYLGTAAGFEDASFRYGLASATRRLLSWGVHLEDFDGDGWLELFTANGHVYPQADRPHTGTSYAQADTLWSLGPEPRARPVAPRSAGSVLGRPSSTRGSAVGDVDGDGAPDLVLVRLDGPAALALGTRTGEHRLVLRCLGPRTPGEGTGGERRTPPDGSGARVELVLADGVRLVREARTAVGYQSASSPWVHFGLGERARYDALVVHWPSGERTQLPGGPADRRLVLREGEGLVSEEALP